MSKSAKAWQGIKFTAIGALSKGISLFDRDWGKRYLVREISKMPGIPSKLAQFLETKYTQPGWKLHSGMAMPMEWVKDKINKSSPDLAREIDVISDEGITASLGQVHWAKLKSGREIAIKIQYPEIASHLKDQLDLMLKAMAILPFKGKYGLDIEVYASFLEEFFLRETDYGLELIDQHRFRDAWSSYNEIIIPEALPDFSNKEVLVQQFESSVWLSSLLNETEAIRAEIAELIGKMLVISVFKLGAIHTDLHSRNWGFRLEEKKIVLYDFGAVLFLDNDMKLAIKELFTAPVKSDNDCMNLFLQIGFDKSKLLLIKSICNILRFLREPLQKDNWSLAEWKLNEKMNDIPDHEKWLFRTAGPPWFLFFMRGLHGALQAINYLNVPISFRSILERETGIICSDFQHSENKPRKNINSSLRVQVKESEKVIVDIALPVNAINDLENIMPDHVLKRMKEEGFNIFLLKKKVIESSYAPQDIYYGQSNCRSYRVWIA